MRKLYWAWPAHLKEGLTVYCDRNRFGAGMVRVRVEVVKPKKRRKR